MLISSLHSIDQSVCGMSAGTAIIFQFIIQSKYGQYTLLLPTQIYM